MAFARFPFPSPSDSDVEEAAFFHVNPANVLCVQAVNVDKVGAVTLIILGYHAKTGDPLGPVTKSKLPDVVEQLEYALEAG